jgi:hypothetical protein
MSVNIACYQPDCAAPVIGQCAGYNKSCGRYYCREHSLDTLCGDCSQQKKFDEQIEQEQNAAKEQADAIYKEYLALAEKVSKEPVDTSKFQFSGKKYVIFGILSIVVGLIVLCLCIILPRIIYLSMGESATSGPVFIILWMLGVLVSFVLVGWPIVVFPVMWFTQLQIWVSKERRKNIVERVKAINQEKQGFSEFWNTWLQQKGQERAEQSKNIFVGVLAVIGVIVAGMLGSAFRESEYDRTRRAVRDEINSR